MFIIMLMDCINQCYPYVNHLELKQHGYNNWVCLYFNHKFSQYTNILIHKLSPYTNILIHKFSQYTNMLIHKFSQYTNMLIHTFSPYTNMLIHKFSQYTNMLIHKFSPYTPGRVLPYLGMVGRFYGDDPRFGGFQSDILYLNTILLTFLSAEKISLSLSDLVPELLGPKVGLIFHQNVLFNRF